MNGEDAWIGLRATSSGSGDDFHCDSTNIDDSDDCEGGRGDMGPTWDSSGGSALFDPEEAGRVRPKLGGDDELFAHVFQGGGGGDVGIGALDEDDTLRDFLCQCDA